MQRKLYVNLSQTGSQNGPTFTDVLRNSIGELPASARTGAGVYTLTKTGAFPLGKTGLKIQRTNTASVCVEHTSADVLTIRTKTIADNTAGDDLLVSTLLEVDIYDDVEA